MLSGAVGLGLFDLTSGWVLWSPMTVISALIMGYILATFNFNKFSLRNYSISIILVTIVKILTYYIGESIMFGSLVAPLASIPGNIIQIIVSAIIVGVLVKPMARVMKNITI